jgi:hypothetical protein
MFSHWTPVTVAGCTATRTNGNTTTTSLRSNERVGTNHTEDTTSTTTKTTTYASTTAFSTILVSNPIVQWNPENVYSSTSSTSTNGSHFISLSEVNQLRHEINNDKNRIQITTTTSTDTTTADDINTETTTTVAKSTTTSTTTTPNTVPSNNNNNIDCCGLSDTDTNTISYNSNNNNNYYYEGFDGPRRLIRFYDLSLSYSSRTKPSSSTNDTTSTTTNHRTTTTPPQQQLGRAPIPSILLQLQDRLYHKTGYRARYCKIEEYIPLVFPSSSSSPNHKKKNPTTTPTKPHFLSPTNESSSSSSSSIQEHDQHLSTATTNTTTAAAAAAPIRKYDPNLMSTFPCSSDDGTTPTTTANHQNGHINNNDDDDATPPFIAEIPIALSPQATSDSCNSDDELVSSLPLIQNWNQPKRDTTTTTTTSVGGRVPIAMRWTLQSEQHMTYVHVPYRTMLLRAQDMCTQWRNTRYMYCIEKNHEHNNNDNNDDDDDSTTTIQTASSKQDHRAHKLRRNKNHPHRLPPPQKRPIWVVQLYNFETPSHYSQSQAKFPTNPYTPPSVEQDLVQQREVHSDENQSTSQQQQQPYQNDTVVTDTFGYIPTNPDEICERTRRLQIMTNGTGSSTFTKVQLPSMLDLVTILITTSPIKSHPSTDVIQQAMDTFYIGGGPSFAYGCTKIIVCDGYRTMMGDNDTTEHPTNTKTQASPRGVDTQHNDHNITETNHANNASSINDNQKNKVNPVSRRHCNDKQSMRNGIVTEQQAQNYCEYKQRLHQLCQDAKSSPNHSNSVFANTRIVELSTRHGYGYAVRHVLQNTDYIQTPYVCVVQHDRTFMRPTPLLETLHAMWYHTHIKYVGFSMRSNLLYRDIYIAKYGTCTKYESMVMYAPQLQVCSTQYGPNSVSTRGLVVQNEKVRQNIQTLTETYRGSAQATLERKCPLQSNHSDMTTKGHGHDPSPDDNDRSGSHHLNETSTSGPISSPLHQISLVPTLYWYDNVHICDTKHYRDFIFHPSYKMVAKGGFIEDKLSPIIKRTVERLGLRDGHSRFGCYLLDDHSGMFFTGHIDGGSYMSPEERKVLLASQQQQQQQQNDH